MVGNVSQWYPTAATIEHLRLSETDESRSRWIVRFEKAAIDRERTPDAALELLNRGTSIFASVHGLGTPGLLLVESPSEPMFAEARL